MCVLRAAAVMALVLVTTPTASAQLNQLAKAAGKLYFGTATDNSELTDTAYAAILNDAAEWGQITPGNAQKWDSTQPSEATFSYVKGDVIRDLAKKNGQLLRCHTLLWHNQLPSWVTSRQWTPQSLTLVIQTHIMNVVSHYKGSCYSWDVVNEAIGDDGNWRASIFYNVLKTDYLPIAFKAAEQADSDAKLYYNDYSIEQPGNKQKKVLEVIRILRAANAKIDGIGLQAHLTVGAVAQPGLENVLRQFLDAGVAEVAYTELDIRHKTLPPSPAAVQQQAADFAAVTQACLSVDKCRGITIWDFSDKYSWIPSVFPGAGEALVMDKNLVKKPAYDRIRDTLAAATAQAGPKTQKANRQAPALRTPFSPRQHK